MVLCLIVGCGNKTGKRRAGKERTRFFRVPRVVTNQGEFIEELTSERRRRWISAISRDDLTEGKRENDRVCSKHFVSGEPAKEWDRFNVDWTVPTQYLGHHKLCGDPEKVAERANRAAQRRKRKQEVLEKEISEKRKRVSEPGKPVEEIFQGVAEAPVTADCPSDTSIYSESTSADQEKFGTIATAEPQTSCTKWFECMGCIQIINCLIQVILQFFCRFEINISYLRKRNIFDETWQKPVAFHLGARNFSADPVENL